MKTLNQSPWQVEGGETLPLLYEIDQQLWLEETIKLLKENRLDELDVIHLIEELESLSKRDKNRVSSLLEQTNLQNYLAEELPIIYQDAFDYVQQKTGFSGDFPSECPYSLEQLLDKNWFHCED
ncbi:MAG: DUF29 domain-containing protein [Microcystis aeruginosa K13-06]|nr:DUF29 domain-containing protein [Microcystis aeruginosa K13-06]